MQIKHIAIWTKQLERMKEFYVKYFQASAGDKYQNPTKQFESYFLSFSFGASLELMSQTGITERSRPIDEQVTGYAHVAFACGAEKNVDELTERMRSNGCRIVDGPRHTGDGYYESVVLDPDGNRIEITI